MFRSQIFTALNYKGNAESGWQSVVSWKQRITRKKKNRKPVQGSILCAQLHKLYYWKNSTRFIQDVFLFYNSCWLPLLIVHRCLLIDWHWCQLHSLLWSHDTCLLLGKMWPSWEMTAELSQHEINHKTKAFLPHCELKIILQKQKTLHLWMICWPFTQNLNAAQNLRMENLCFPAGCSLLPLLGDSTESAH